MVEPRRPWWRAAAVRCNTVRLRTTAGAVVVVGLALTAAAVMLVVVMRSTLLEQVADAAELQAQEIAAQLAAGGAPSLA